MLKSLVPPRLPARTPSATPSPASQRRGSGGSASVASNNTIYDATPLNSSTGGRRSSNSVERSIQVCVRIRPLNHREMQMQGHDRPSWRWDNDKIVQNVVPGTEKTSNNTAQLAGFEFDHLFYPDSLTQDIYEKAVKGVVLRTMEGYHGSVLAYGQTSTGKTFTMGGVGTQPGVIPLAVEECFGYVAASSEDREFLFQVSYLEIYNEQINDLLCPASTNVRIVSDKRDGVAVVGNKSEVVISPQQVYALISAGEAQRHIGATDANKNSSRSHTIFRMTIESRARDGGSGKQRSRVSTLSLVDLAGSESAKLSNTRGERQLEGAFINRSLLTLGHIIYKLTEEDRSGRANEDFQKHLPYRDSKLTRLLQPSLGGNAQIAIICTVSPAAANVEETRNTLKFASRAKRMRNTARVNDVLDQDTLLRKYREEISNLREQLAEARAAASHGGGGGGSGGGGAHSHQGSSELSLDGLTIDSEDESEIQLQNAISHLERLILKSRIQAPESPLSGSARSRTLPASGPSSPDVDLFFRARKPVHFGSSGGAAAQLRMSAPPRPATATGAGVSGAALPPPSPSHKAVSPRPPPRAPRTRSREAFAVDAEDESGGGGRGVFEIGAELERVHTELREFLQRKRRQRGGAAAAAAAAARSPAERRYDQGDADNGSDDLLSDTAPSSQHSRATTAAGGGGGADSGSDYVAVLERLERAQRALEADNAALRAEVARLSAVLLARETELLALKGVAADEEMF